MSERHLMGDISAGLAGEQTVKVVFSDKRRHLVGLLGQVGKMGVDVGCPSESEPWMADMGKARKTCWVRVVHLPDWNERQFLRV